MELAYATTAHGAQGDTVTAAHLVVGEDTGAAAAYVGMTRGRTPTPPTSSRPTPPRRGSSGSPSSPATAPTSAPRTPPGWPPPRPPATPSSARWSRRSPTCTLRGRPSNAAWIGSPPTCRAGTRCARSSRSSPPTPTGPPRWKPAIGRQAIDARHATARADASGAAVTAETDRIRDTLLDRWDTGRDAARDAAQVVLDGPGRLRLRRAAVNRAGEQLVDWADAWRPYLPAMPTDPQQIARLADRSDDRPRLWTAFDSYARHHAEHAHPEHAQLRATAATAQEAHRHAGAAVADARRQHEDRLARFGPLAWTLDPAERLADTDRDIAAAHTELAAVRARIARLTAEPALLAQPADRLARERDPWRARPRPRARHHPATRLPVGATAAGRPTAAPMVRRFALRPDAGRGMSRAWNPHGAEAGSQARLRVLRRGSAHCAHHGLKEREAVRGDADQKEI